MNLSTRLTVAMVALVLLTATSVGFLTYRDVEALVLPRGLNRLDAGTRLLAAELAASVGAARADVVGFRSAVAVQGLIGSHLAGGIDPLDGTGEAMWRARMAARYAAELAAKPNYLAFRIIGADDGREIVRVDRSGPGNSVRVVPDAELQPRGDRDYVQATIRLAPGEVYVSPIDLSRDQQGMVATPHLPVLRVATPLQKPDGSLFGLVIINVDMRPTLTRIRAAAQDGGQVYLVNQAGDYLMHPDPALEFGFDLGTRVRLQDDFPDFARLLDASSTAPRVLQDRAGSTFGVAWTGLRPADGPRVIVVEAMPYAALMAPAIAVRNSSLLGALAAALCAIVLAILLTRSLTRPLAQMARAAAKFTEGAAAAIPTGAGGEVGTVAQAFARMAREVHDKTTALEHAVDQHRRTESALHTQEQRGRLFSAAVESSDDAIVTKTLDGIITGWNPGAERMFGYSAEEAIGSPIDLIVPEDRRAELHDILARIGRGEKVRHHETVRVTKDKRRLDISLSVSPVRTSDGTIIGAAKIGRDITAKKRVQEALVDSDRMAREIIATALDGVVQMDASGTIIDWNPQAEAIFGWQRDEAIGKVLGDLIVPERHRPGHSAGLARYLQEGDSAILGRRLELEALRRDGKEVMVELSVTALRVRGATVFNGFIRDLTEKIAAEERRRQSQKMEAVGQLVGGIAHDFNNMLTVITGTIEILAEGVAHDSQLVSIAKLISEAADRGAELTGHLLAFARKQPLQPRETDINDLIHAACGLFRPSLGEPVEIEVALEDNVWPALIDPTQLTTALINLAVNARDAMPTGGKLTLETKNVVLDESYARANRDAEPGDYVMIAVSDTGGGIPAALLERIFEPFFTTKEAGKGTGLGLSMVYGFVKQSSGHIKIYSEEGHGTTIKLYLPRAGAQPERATSGMAVIEGGSETVLVVEDDALVRGHVTTRLKNLGYRTLEAANAAEALAIADRGAAFDLLFTDVILSGAMNGRQLADEMARRRSGLKVLFTSGYTENAIVHHGRLDPGVLLLAKPYRNADLPARSARRSPARPRSRRLHVPAKPAEAEGWERAVY